MSMRIVFFLAFIITPSAVFATSIGQRMNQTLMRKTLNVQKGCKVFQYPKRAVYPALLDFWCGGKLAHRLEDGNQDRLVDRSEIHDRRQIFIEQDRNFDKKVDFKSQVRAGRSAFVVYEESDDNFSGAFKKRKYQSSFEHEQLGGKCENKILPDFIHAVGERYSSETNSFFDQNCPDSLKPLYEDGLRRGLECLEKLGETSSMILAGKVRSLIERSGEPIKIECETLSSNIIAKASVPGSPKFPAIQFNSNKLQTSAKIPNTAFHEFLHLTGITHYHDEGNTKSIDNVIACENCCFGFSDAGYLSLSQNNKAETLNAKFGQDLACRFCSGQSTDREQYTMFMSRYGVGEVKSAFSYSMSQIPEEKKSKFNAQSTSDSSIKSE